MKLVIDASVAVKWHLDQPGSDIAKGLGREASLIAPEFVLAEIASALWKYVRANELSAELADLMIVKSPKAFTRLFPLEPLQLRAFQLACCLDHPAYDCFYLALAEREFTPLITADRRLVAKAKSLSDIDVRALDS